MNLLRSLTVVVAVLLIAWPLSAAEPSAKPRVLLLGDSISIGYTPLVQEMLRNDAEVLRPTRPNGQPENCSGTTYGVAELDRWLAIGGGNWDVIHFNFGLHDLKRQNPATGTASNSPADPPQADLETYRRHLSDITQRLKATGATVVFATTTPVPGGPLSPHRDPNDVRRYNAAALEIMRTHGVAIDDLYTFAADRLENIQRPANVHFTQAGSKQLAEQVVASVRAALKTNNTAGRHGSGAAEHYLLSVGRPA